MRPLLAVRADGGPGIGAGHLARCLALVQAWTSGGGDAVLVSRRPPEPWAGRYREAGCTILDPEDPRPVAAWWVVDGYVLTPADRDGRGARVLVIDDGDEAGTAGRGADLLLDQNLAATWYPDAGDVRSGPRYALLRSDVLAAAAGRRDDRGDGLLVAVGGAPSAEVRAFAEQVRAGAEQRGLHVTVLSGGDDAAAAMARAGLAVAAAGSTAWELCHLGVPSVLVAVAPNQEPLRRDIAATGAAVASPLSVDAVLDEIDRLRADDDRRHAMSQAGRALVDGRGAARIATRLRSDLLVLRDATDEDVAPVYAWSNDPATRAASFQSDPIPWEDHVRWFAARRADPMSLLLVGSDQTGDVGLVRFQVHAGTAEIGITIAPDRRGERLAAALIVAGCRRLAGTGLAKAVRAQVKADNRASVRAFLAADFDSAVEQDDPPDADVLRFVGRLGAETTPIRSRP